MRIAGVVDQIIHFVHVWQALYRDKDCVDHESFMLVEPFRNEYCTLTVIALAMIQPKIQIHHSSSLCTVP